MTTILNLSERKYDEGIAYIQDISSRGWIFQGLFIYQIDNRIGRGLVKANPVRQTIELTDSVDRATAENLLQIAKPRRDVI